MNVALYGPAGRRWTMTERPRGAVSRAADLFAVGPSAMRWEAGALLIDIDERDKRVGIPWRRPVRGQVRVTPEMLSGESFALDPAGRHVWRALAPKARIELTMAEPALRWRGSGYFDSNHGAEPLEAGFRDWQWSRAHLADGAAVLYEGLRADGSAFASALRFDASGKARQEELPPAASLAPTMWAMRRRTRSDTGRARVLRTWENAPFYARSTLATRLFGERVAAVHESLSLTRFSSPLVQFMLPYRMPRGV
ncbi:MAG: hydroxyneurosporene dehydrogenase [Sphingomonadaceae bacterium]